MFVFCLNHCLCLLLFQVSNQIQALEQQLRTINFTQIFFVEIPFILSAFSHKIFAWDVLKYFERLFQIIHFHNEELDKQLVARRAKHDF